MPKISQFTTAAAPSLSDKLIGTSVSGSPTNQTNNFTLQEIKDLFDGGPTPPSPTLQSVLNAGNTAIQNIYLTGELEAIDLTIANDASSKNLYLAERFFDKNNSAGTNGQYLTSTGSGVQWSTLTIPIPTLQQVLTAGNVSDKDITTTGDIQADSIQGTNITANSNLRVVGTLADSTNSVGGTGQVLSSTGTGTDWVDLPAYSAVSPLIYNNVLKQFSIQQATSTQNGYLSSADWITFDGKQNAGNYITALTGEASASGPGSVSITLNNLAVINKTLTGFTALSGSVTAADSIITAFGKLQNQINSATSGLSYQGVWNAATNTPALASSIGLNGQYYVVDVAGSTNLNGITDWKVGDWAIFNGSSWQKIDNTDSVVSVNGQIGIVVLNSDDIAEGTTNLYYTDTRARNSISSLATGLTYTAGTGVFSLTTGYSIPTIANQTDWTTAYNNSIVSAAVTGTTTKTLTLTQQDGGTITANWTEPDLTGFVPYVGATQNVTLGYNSLSGAHLLVNGPSAPQGGFLGFKQSTNVVTGSAGYTSMYAVGQTYLGFVFPQTPSGYKEFSFNASGITNNVPGGRIYSMPDADGTLALTSNLTSYVPYTGATSNVNLGEYGLTTGFLGFDLTPTATPTTVGTMYWDTAYRTASLVAGVGTNTLQIGQEEVLLVHNNTGSALTNGQVVYVTGSTGELPSISLADASSESTSAATLGVVSESIANGADGFVTVSGIVHGINTLAYNEGDILWLSETAGQFTTVKPISPAHLVLIGYVIKKSGGNGSILVKIQNTQELEESSDVLISAPKLDGQGLFLQTVSGTQLWRNRSISDVLGYTPANAATAITSLTGEATATGPGASSVTLSNSAVTGKVLTGLNVTGNAILATDSVLSAFGKLQNQVNQLIGGLQYEGTWNASTNTPAITSGVGTDGTFYIVSVAGSTNIDGITDWQVGDWIVFHTPTWQKVDNTDSVNSVFGRVGVVTAASGDYNTSQVTESGNLYYTDARSRAALSFAAGSGAYDNITGVITIPTNNNQITNGAGYITSAALGAYLPLTGGTLTGALNGTSASFSGTVTTPFIGVTGSTGQIGNINSTNANGGYITWQTSGTTIADLGSAQQIFGAGGSDTFGINARGARSLMLGTNDTTRLTISSTGAATFSSSVSAASLSGAFATLSNYGSATSTVLQLGDANNGLFRPALNSVAIATNGAAALTIASTGAATFSSSVTATSFNLGNGQFLRLTRTSGGLQYDALGIVAGTDNTRLISTGDFDIVNGALTSYFKVSSTGAATFSGRVGVGGASATYSLTAYNASNGTTAAFGGTARGIRIDNDGAFSSGRSTIFGVDSTFYGSYQPLSIEASSLALQAVTGGNVGIGTSSPSYKLDVNGNIRGIESLYLALPFGPNNFNAYRLWADPLTEDFIITNTFSNSNNFRISYGGNVLIGTSTDLGFRTDSRDSLIISNTQPASNFSSNTGEFYIRGEVRYDMGPTINYYPSLWRQRLENIGVFSGTSNLVWTMSANGGAYTEYMRLRTDSLEAPAFVPTGTSGGGYNGIVLSTSSGGLLFNSTGAARQDFDGNGHARFKTSNFYQNEEKKRTIFGNANIAPSGSITVNVTFAASCYVSICARAGGLSFGGQFNAMTLFGIDTTNSSVASSSPASSGYMQWTATQVSSTSWNITLTNWSGGTTARVAYEIEINASNTITN
jgi:hypothetical protein